MLFFSWDKGLPFMGNYAIINDEVGESGVLMANCGG